jgi:hypothetical protein
MFGVNHMTTRTTFVCLVCIVVGVIVLADSYRPRTVAEKVTDAEMIVRGVATLDGLPLEPTEHPVERSCSIVVLQTLWPTNQPGTNIIVVRHYAWTKWPDTWWNYNSQTGVYFFKRTTTVLMETREQMKRRDPQGLIKIDNSFLGTNTWTPLDRFDDWYEPATNVAAIHRLIESKKP